MYCRGRCADEFQRVKSIRRRHSKLAFRCPCQPRSFFFTLGSDATPPCNFESSRPCSTHLNTCHRVAGLNQVPQRAQHGQPRADGRLCQELRPRRLASCEGERGHSRFASAYASAAPLCVPRCAMNSCLAGCVTPRANPKKQRITLRAWRATGCDYRSIVISQAVVCEGAGPTCHRL